MPNRHFLRSDIFTFVMVYSFYFLLVGSRRNECNSLWEELRGRGQKSTATQKVCLPAFLLALTLYLQWSILFIFCVLVPYGMNSIVLGGIKGGERSEVYCLLGRISHQKKMIYCDNIIINLSCKVIACGIILSSVKLEKKVQHSENDIRISHNLLSPSPISFPNTIAFVPSGAKTQKKEIIPYPRCGFGACLRCG